MEKTTMQWMVEPLRKYADFSGRARRAEFWWFYLFTMLVRIVFQIMSVVLAAAGSTIVSVALGGIGLVVSLGFLVPQLAVSARRLHDTDRSGWWMLLPLAGVVPIVGAFVTGGAALFAGAASSATPTAGIGLSVALFGLGGLAFLVLGILVLVWYCTAGTVGPNRFGNDPLGRDDIAEVFS